MHSDLPFEKLVNGVTTSTDVFLVLIHLITEAREVYTCSETCEGGESKMLYQGTATVKPSTDRIEIVINTEERLPPQHQQPRSAVAGTGLATTGHVFFRDFCRQTPEYIQLHPIIFIYGRRVC